MRRAVIVAIGDELLSGETVDTNSSYLDGLLEARGYTVTRHFTAPDDTEAVAQTLTAAASQAELVLSTGGLGPTQDDLTMQSFARALGCELQLDTPTLEHIEGLFAKLGREMSPNNRRQAMLPALGRALQNDVGTAPGCTAELSGAQVYLMPGVPREVRWLMKHRVLPELEMGPTRLRRTLKVVGLGESRIEHRISEVVQTHSQVRFGYRTLGLENHVKLLAEGDDAQAKLQAAEDGVRARLGDLIYGADEDVLEAVIGELLSAQGQTLVCAESCTGGLVAKRITDVSGSSRYMLGGVVAYANAVKTEIVGVDPAAIEAKGAVSETVVRQMAEGVRARLKADWGLATSGVAGPGGGTEQKPVGTVWLAVAGPSGVQAQRVQLPGDRDQIRNLAGSAVLNMLRLALRDAAPSA